MIPTGGMRSDVIQLVHNLAYTKNLGADEPVAIEGQAYPLAVPARRAPRAVVGIEDAADITRDLDEALRW